MSNVDDGEAVQMAHHTMPPNYSHDRTRLQYELTVRQEPKQARMCGIGGKADRRPIDPPVIVQLRVIDPAAPPPDDKPTEQPDKDELPYANLAGYAQSFLQNPYYFMFASLAKPDDDMELHWLKDGRTRCTTGSVVSSLYALKDPTAPSATTTAGGGTSGAGNGGGPVTAPPASDAGFFVFPDLSVRTEGSYRLKLSLFEVVGNDVRHCKSIYSAPFYVYTAKKFPGVEESSPLTCSLADQGIKIRIRKDIRMRKARIQGLERALPAMPMPTVDPDPPEEKRPAKRSRTEDNNNHAASGAGAGTSSLNGSGNTGGAPPVGTAWPSTPLPSAIPPPDGAQVQVAPPLPVPVAEVSVYDGRGGYAGPYDTHAPPPPPQAPQQQQQVIPPPPPPGYRAEPMPPPPHPHPHQHQHPQHPHQQHPQHPQQLPHPHQQQHPYAHPPPPPPQYQHPYYPYPPPQWAGQPGYGVDPYAHHQHQQYAIPRYDYGGYAPPPPPPPPHHPYPYYEHPPQPQPQYDYGAGAGAGGGAGGAPPGYVGAPPPQQQHMGAPAVGGNGTPNGNATASPGIPNPPPSNNTPPGRPPPQQYAYRPYPPPPPPPYYGYPPPQQQHPGEQQQQQQQQAQHTTWGTPPFAPPQV
ncbi:velvet factor-domain-containing protein, partial [Mycena sp. CBHHK59/15]